MAAETHARHGPSDDLLGGMNAMLVALQLQTLEK